MEKPQFCYFSKNIPIPSEQSYILQLIEKIELNIKWVRWKALFYRQGSNKYIPENYDLKILNYPLKIKEMSNFGNDLTNVLKNIKFGATKSSSQQQLTKDTRTIKNTKATLTFAVLLQILFRSPKNSKKS